MIGWLRFKIRYYWHRLTHRESFPVIIDYDKEIVSSVNKWLRDNLDRRKYKLLKPKNTIMYPVIRFYDKQDKNLFLIIFEHAVQSRQSHWRDF